MLNVQEINVNAKEDTIKFLMKLVKW